MQAGMEIQIHPSPEALHAAAAAWLADELTASAERVETAEQGTASWALAGGSTPRPVYELLAAEPHRAAVPWERLEIFWGDERCVPPDDPASNHRMAREALLDRVPVAPQRVHRWRGELAQEPAARLYADELTAVLGRPPRLDLVLLGLGGDGHTASLFPAAFADGIDDPHPHRLAVPATAPTEPRRRLTLTLGTLNAARRVVFLVAGDDKAEAVARTLAPRPGAVSTPASRVRPADGSVTWLLDAAAAASLPAELRRTTTNREETRA
jgi:6-phosphogluconolactonase